MKRRRRRRFKLVCRWVGGAVLVLWALSFARQVNLVWGARSVGGMRSIDCVQVYNGLIVVYHNLSIPWPSGLHTTPPYDFRLDLRQYAIGQYYFAPNYMGTSATQWIVMIPATAPIGLGAALIGYSFLWGRQPRGHCQNCGYSLAGIADKCPECGGTIPPVKKNT